MLINDFGETMLDSSTGCYEMSRVRGYVLMSVQENYMV